MITNEGLNYLLDVGLHDASKIATWYIGLIGSTSFLALAAADTMSAHTGWAESSAYSESVRQTLVEAAASGQEMTSSNATFTANGTVTIKGFFIASDNTKGGATGTLLATKLFQGGDRSYVSGDKIVVNISFKAQDTTP